MTGVEAFQEYQKVFTQKAKYLLRNSNTFGFDHEDLMQEVFLEMLPMQDVSNPYGLMKVLVKRKHYDMRAKANGVERKGEAREVVIRQQHDDFFSITEGALNSEYEVVNASETATPEDIILNKEHQELVELRLHNAIEAIDGLTKKPKVIMTLVAEGKTLDEIESMLGINRKSIIVQIFNSRKILREKLDAKTTP